MMITDGLLVVDNKIEMKILIGHTRASPVTKKADFDIDWRQDDLYTV